jgi:mannose-6-phosphate isomerase-like protein (cupin superfamily)
MIVTKDWGYEHVLVNEPEYCLKILRILPKKKCSLHYHDTKKETFFVRDGFMRLEHGNSDELLKPGEQRTIMPKTTHRFSSILGATILEVSTHHSDADVVRIEPSGSL